MIVLVLKLWPLNFNPRWIPNALNAQPLCTWNQSWENSCEAQHSKKFFKKITTDIVVQINYRSISGKFYWHFLDLSRQSFNKNKCHFVSQTRRKEYNSKRKEIRFKRKNKGNIHDFMRSKYCQIHIEVWNLIFSNSFSVKFYILTKLK